jgi:hypothetical protein
MAVGAGLRACPIKILFLNPGKIRMGILGKRILGFEIKDSLY